MIVLALFGCGASSDDMNYASAPEAVMEEAPMGDVLAGEGYGGGAPGGYGGGAGAKEAPISMGIVRGASPAKSRLAQEPEAPPPPEAPEGAGGGESVRTWFPEAFLWQPLVETDAAGKATVAMRVPDQLTTWRVLALASTMGGRQAGAVATFDSSLPVYVDPVVPAFLYAGDQVRLPVQVVNTTGDPTSAALTVEAGGALTGSAAGSLLVAAGGTSVQSVLVDATGAGAGLVKARLTGHDAAERTVAVLPVGRPVTSVRGGTVASARSFELAGPAGADPRTEQATVLVFPGPLAVLQAEVERGGSGVSPWSAAYGFALAERMGELSAAVSVEADPKAVRKLRLVSWQRVVKYSYAPDPGVAADLLAAMGGVEGHEQATELAKRLERTVAEGQRGDGTWARQSSTSLQQVLVQTAFAARTLPADREGAVAAARRKAGGALERHVKDIDDPYTAAVVVASGVVDGSVRELLVKQVLDGVVTEADGRKTVAVPAQARSPWGSVSRSEMLAWTVLALEGVPEAKEWRGDLVAELMAGYDAQRGFGAGGADVVALEAVLESLPALDKTVTVVLKKGGVEVDRATLDPSQPKVPALLTGPGQGGYEVVVEPPVAGMSFVATLHSWVPWTGAEALGGVEVEVASSAMAAGQDGTVTLTLSAPSGTRLWVEQGIPAGAVVDEDRLAGLSDRLVEWEVETDRVRLQTRGFGAGEVMTIPLVVRPAYAGTFQTVPLVVESVGDPRTKTSVAPIGWDVTSR